MAKAGLVSDQVFGANLLGVKDVIDGLQKMGHTITKTAIRRGLYQGAVVLRDEARRRAPVLTGALKKSVVAETRGIVDRGKGRQHIAVVTIKKGNVFFVNQRGRLQRLQKGKGLKISGNKAKISPRKYAHLVEFGTKPHQIKLPGGAILAHPGAPPKAFMRPALDTKKGAATEAVRQHLLAEVQKAATNKRKR